MQFPVRDTYRCCSSTDAQKPLALVACHLWILQNPILVNLLGSLVDTGVTVVVIVTATGATVIVVQTAVIRRWDTIPIHQRRAFRAFVKMYPVGPIALRSNGNSATCAARRGRPRQVGHAPRQLLAHRCIQRNSGTRSFMVLSPSDLDYAQPIAPTTRPGPRGSPFAVLRVRRLKLVQGQNAPEQALQKETRTSGSYSKLIL